MDPLFTNALTIDVEDWYHPELVREHVDTSLVEPRIAQAVFPILALLKRHGVKASFFILGEVALKFPGLIRRIHGEGHEIGCHGMSHRMLGDLGEEKFRKELEEFRELMKGILGEVEIKGFRAPTFSLSRDTKWALPILTDFGYLYDASVFPVKLSWNPLYGLNGAPRFPYRVSFDDPGREDPKSPLWEFPAPVLDVGGVSIPVAGGFYLRAMPLSFFKWGLKRMGQKGPFHIYLHPWECDENTPRVPLSRLSGAATYYGMARMLSKVEGLLRTFRFSRMDNMLEELEAGR